MCFMKCRFPVYFHVVACLNTCDMKADWFTLYSSMIYSAKVIASPLFMSGDI